MKKSYFLLSVFCSTVILVACTPMSADDLAQKLGIEIPKNHEVIQEYSDTFLTDAAWENELRFDQEEFDQLIESIRQSEGFLDPQAYKAFIQETGYKPGDDLRAEKQFQNNEWVELKPYENPTAYSDAYCLQKDFDTNEFYCLGSRWWQETEGGNYYYAAFYWYKPSLQARADAEMDLSPNSETHAEVNIDQRTLTYSSIAW